MNWSWLSLDVSLSLPKLIALLNMRMKLLLGALGAFPAYPILSGEAGVANVTYPYGHVKRYGAKCDGVADDSPATQLAADYCVSQTPPTSLKVEGRCRLAASVNLDRLVDAATSDQYMTIEAVNGGGFYVTTAIAMFSSSIPFTTDPVTQCFLFDDVVFEASSAALAAYVLDDARFLRTHFSGCSFIKIKCLTASVYTQSISFSNRCNARRWAGTFFNSAASSFDIRFGGMMAEAGVNFASLTIAEGCSFIGNLLEGLSGTAIAVDTSKGLVIHGNYGEKNAIDIDLRTGSHLGVSHAGNHWTLSVGTYNVFWDTVEASSSVGNYSTGGSGLHSLTANSRVTIQDDSGYPGLHLPSARTTGATLNLPHGTAPTSPSDGDVWTTAAGGLYVRVNGATIGPLS